MTERLDNYIDVAERINNFNARYPEGSLQTVAWEVQTIGDRLFVVYQAAAYRTPDDHRPGVGTAWEPFPGATPFTRDSELMNAETAAWGRAIVACGLTSNRKIATKQDIEARSVPNGTSTSRAPQPQAKPPQQTQAPANAGQKGKIFARAAEKNMSSSQLANVLKAVVGQPSHEWPSEEDAHKWLQRQLERWPANKVDDLLAGIASAPEQLALASE